MKERSQKSVREIERDEREGCWATRYIYYGKLIRLIHSVQKTSKRAKLKLHCKHCLFTHRDECRSMPAYMSINMKCKVILRIFFRLKINRQVQVFFLLLYGRNSFPFWIKSSDCLFRNKTETKSSRISEMICVICSPTFSMITFVVLINVFNWMQFYWLNPWLCLIIMSCVMISRFNISVGETTFKYSKGRLHFIITFTMPNTQIKLLYLSITS